MASYPWVSIDTDEEVLVNEHPSKWTLADELVTGVGLILVALFVAVATPIPMEPLSYRWIPGGVLLVTAAVLVATAMIGVSALYRVNTVYLISTKQVYRKEGLFSYHGDPIDIPDVVDQEASQNIIERQLGIGTVTIKTAATAELSDDESDVGHLRFQRIPNPIEVKHELKQAKKRYRKHAKQEEIKYEREIKQGEATAESQSRSGVQQQNQTTTEQEQNEQEALWG